MTRERAIQLAKKWSNGLACSLCEGEAEEYHKMFLEMLCAARIKRAQRKKRKKEERVIK